MQRKFLLSSIKTYQSYKEQLACVGKYGPQLKTDKKNTLNLFNKKYTTKHRKQAEKGLFTQLPNQELGVYKFGAATLTTSTITFSS